jgi:hypothetical protein
MLDRESVARRNAIDYLDDLLIGAKATDLTDSDKSQIAMFLIEALIPEVDAEEEMNLTALLTQENAP